jgi:hypothetical protein
MLFTNLDPIVSLLPWQLSPLGYKGSFDYRNFIDLGKTVIKGNLS